jgi:hypothetical protein
MIVPRVSGMGGANFKKETKVLWFGCFVERVWRRLDTALDLGELP